MGNPNISDHQTKIRTRRQGLITRGVNWKDRRRLVGNMTRHRLLCKEGLFETPTQSLLKIFLPTDGHGGAFTIMNCDDFTIKEKYCKVDCGEDCDYIKECLNRDRNRSGVILKMRGMQ